MAMSLPSGWLTGLLGGQRTLAYGMLLNSILAILSPVVARCSLDLLIVLRAVQGLGQVGLSCQKEINIISK